MPQSLLPPLLVVAGPTAGGKSELALRLAQELPGEILSLDSVQIYRGANIGSAKVGAAERALVPHHLLDICDPNERYSAAQFVRDSESVLPQIVARGRQTVLVGGTNLYLTALLHGLADLVRGSEALQARLKSLSDEELHSELRSLDALSAERLHPHDRFRVSRALETAIESGTSASELRAQHGFTELRHAALVIVVCPQREVLYERINRRSVEMLDRGLVAETEALLARYGCDVAPLKTLGYLQAVAYLEGRLPYAKLAEEIAMHTRRFAKRQMTYWRNEPTKRGWKVDTESDPALLIPREKACRRRVLASAEPSAVAAVSLPEVVDGARRRLAQLGNEVVVWYLASGAGPASPL